MHPHSTTERYLRPHSAAGNQGREHGSTGNSEYTHASADDYSRSASKYSRRPTPAGKKRRNLLPFALAGLFALILVGAFAINQIRGISSKATVSNQFLTANDSTAPVATAAKPATLLPTPLVAEYGSVLIHLPVTTKDLTEVAFHQASYDWALVMTTQLPTADAEAAYNHKGTTRAASQPTGDVYMDGSALHLWRTSETTDMDTSIDCGAAIGKTVYAPVTGTVVLVTEYNLFKTLMDYEIHIQPTGHPELDVVVLHTTDLKVKAGDKVEGGVTPISVIRDIGAVSGVQLEPYTAEDDPGCHAHVQVNDTNYEGYREKKLVGAIAAS